MKKLFNWAFAMALVVPSICFVSCSDDDPEVTPPTEDPETPVNPTPPTDETAMTSAEQKERLESVALEVANLIPASDFTQIKSLGHYISDTYFDDYDWENVEDWADDIFEDLKDYVSRTKENGWWDEIYIYDNYKAIVAASNFTGHFTARKGLWEYSKANDLQFIFTDRAGAQCVLKLETSGSTKNVYVGDIEDYEDYDYDRSTGTWTEYYDRTQLTISVPEHIVVTLTQGGSNVVKASVDIDLKSISANNEFNFATNSFTVSSKVELNNGYTFNASQVAYTANSKASVSCSISKNGTSLVSMSVSADVSGIPNCNLSAFTSDPEDFDWDDANGKNALVKVDVLGKVQIQGTLTDVRSFANNLEDAEDNDENENKFKQYINKANSLADVNVFYDNSSTKQATVTLEPFEEKDYYGSYWSVEPTIHFYDGSSYSFDVFFNEKDFKKVINAYEKLGEEYEDLFE